MKKFHSPAAIPALFAILAPSVALAHPGGLHTHSMLQGLSHPLTGLDHILAMVAVGLWAAQRGGTALWLWPLAFVSVMLAGGILGMEGVALSFVEPAIAASIFVLGLMVASAARLPFGAGAGLIGGFALFHGNAHGLEATAGTQSLLYALGFVASTAALHAVGIAAGLAMRRPGFDRLLQAGGAAAAGIGAVLFFA